MMVVVCCVTKSKKCRFPVIQFRKLNSLFHHVSSVVSVFVRWSLPDMPFFVSFCPILSRHMHSVAPLHAVIVPNSVSSVLICVHPLSSDAFWLPTLSLPCPVLSCSAANLFPFHWQRPSFPPSISLPISFCCSILQVCSSLAGQGVTEEEGGDRGRQECQTLSCAADILGLSLSTFIFAASFWIRIVAVYNKRWQITDSNSEVGTCDRCVSHDLVVSRCATRAIVRCVFFIATLEVISCCLNKVVLNK